MCFNETLLYSILSSFSGLCFHRSLILIISFLTLPSSTVSLFLSGSEKMHPTLRCSKGYFETPPVKNPERVMLKQMWRVGGAKRQSVILAWAEGCSLRPGLLEPSENWLIHHPPEWIETERKKERERKVDFVLYSYPLFCAGAISFSFSFTALGWNPGAVCSENKTSLHIIQLKFIPQQSWLCYVADTFPSSCNVGQYAYNYRLKAAPGKCETVANRLPV